MEKRMQNEMGVRFALSAACYMRAVGNARYVPLRKCWQLLHKSLSQMEWCRHLRPCLLSLNVVSMSLWRCPERA